MSPEFARSAGQGGAEAAIIYGSIERDREMAAAAISAGAGSSARAVGNARADSSARTAISAGTGSNARAGNSARTTSSAGASGSARATGSARAGGAEGGGEVTAELSHGKGRVAAPVGAYADKVKKAATHPFCDIQPLFHIVGQRRGDPGGKEQRAAERGGARIDEGADLTEELRHYL